jgi:hypothetical protein
MRYKESMVGLAAAAGWRQRVNSTTMAKRLFMLWQNGVDA